MKKILILTTMAAAMFAASCNKEPNNNVPAAPEKSKEAKLLTLKVSSGDVTIDALAYEKDKVFELVYLPEQFDALKNATAVATCSEKATISPDPATARDYTDAANPVKYTVTAEDNTVKVEYKVVLKAAETQITAEETWVKKYAELGTAATAWQTSQIAFVAKDKFATADGNVYDLDGKKVGVLNTTGLPNKTLVSMSNDVNGILVATVGKKSDGSAPANGDEIQSCTFWSWIDGYDKAPKKIYENANNVAMYMNCAGDIKGAFIINAIAPSRLTDNQLHHTFFWESGVIGSDGNSVAPGWRGLNTHCPANDGNWGQQICPASGDIKGKFVICDSRGENKGLQILVRQGFDGKTDTPLNGTIKTDGIATEHGGENQYGNYTVGHARTFSFFGEDFVCVASSGWAAGYITVQSLDPDKDYIFRGKAYETATPFCSSAFVFDESSQTGHIVVNQASHQVVRIDVKRTVI